MKKYIYILIAVMTAILVSSCATSRRGASETIVSNEPYEYDGEGYSNVSKDDAIFIAIAQAYTKIGLSCSSEVQTEILNRYNQTQTAKSLNERGTYEKTVRIYSDVKLSDVVLKIEELPKRLNKKKTIFAYGVTATVDSSNVTPIG